MYRVDNRAFDIHAKCPLMFILIHSMHAICVFYESLKVSKFQNEFMKSSFLPKYELNSPKI